MSDVAKKAGVHPSTVSLALRNHPSIPNTTRERIRALAEAMGYRPNPLVSALISERRRKKSSGYATTIAFMTAGDEPDQWKQSPNYVAIHKAMQHHAERHGYRLERFWLEEPGMSPERCRHIFMSRGIRGIVVCPIFGLPRELGFNFSDFAAIKLGYTVSMPALHRVCIDYYKIAQIAMERLLASGHKRIGLATTLKVDSRVNHLSLSAFLVERHIYPKHFIAPLTSKQWDKKRIVQWLQRTKPDAVIVTQAHDYRLFQEVMRQESISIPRDLSLICTDCVPDSRQTGVVQDLAALGRIAIELVTSNIERGSFGVPERPQMTTVDGYWQEGDSFCERQPSSISTR
jgi:DNA-binding LacI/PurR family transcriptional regulator